KYVGVTLNGRLNFEAHFSHLAPRGESVAALLGRLLSNIDGPEEKIRNLYTRMIRSTILYGSPI
ncbi:hypothetical protein WN51_13319, partial [Melipona quadrifasciata]